MTYSGGPEGRTQVQEISIHKTPSGTLYVDNKGTKCIEFAPQNGIMKFDNPIGFKVMWKRGGQFPMVNQPSSYSGFNVLSETPSTPPPSYYSSYEEK